MAINNIINDQWQGHSHGEVENALKALLAQMLQDIEVAGIPAGGVTADMLAQSLQTLINGKYSKPSAGVPANDLEGNIPASKLASAVQSSLGKADTALQSESDPVFAASAAHGITSTDINNWNNKASSAAIPTKTSDLTNDSGFVTDEDIEDFVTAESIEEIVMGSADVSVIEADGYINIVFATASITVKVGNDEVSGISLHTDGTAHESEQLSISGNHLKANIGAALSGAGVSDYELSTDGTTYDSTATITVTNEAVSNASLYVRYKGAKTAGTVSDATLTLTAGSFSKTISLHYSYASGPYISASPATLSFSAASGSTTDAKTLAVTGSQLTAGINATVIGTGFTVSASESGTYGNQASLPSSGGTLYVKFSPTGSSASTGTLTLASTGATSKTVTLTGAVSTITVSVNSLSLSTDQGGSATGTFTVEGANLNENISIVASGTGFSVSPNTIAHSNGSVASTTVTVTYSPSTAGTHTGEVTIQSSGVSKTVTLQGTVVETPNFTSANNYRLQVNGIYYDVMMSNNTPTTNLRVNNSSYSGNAAANSYAGDIVIPSTISGKLDGVATTFTVKDIRTNAFSRCSSLNSVVVPDSVTAIHDYAFCNSALKRLVIGNGVPGFTIGSTNYNNVIGGSTVLDVADFGTAFMDFGPPTSNNIVNMSANGKVYIRWTGSRESGGSTYYHARAEVRPFRDASGNLPSAAKLYVPSGKVSNYQGSGDWAAMFSQGNILAIDE